MLTLTWPQVHPSQPQLDGAIWLALGKADSATRGKITCFSRTAGLGEAEPLVGLAKASAGRRGHDGRRPSSILLHFISLPSLDSNCCFCHFLLLIFLLYTNRAMFAKQCARLVSTRTAVPLTSYLARSGRYYSTASPAYEHILTEVPKPGVGLSM